MNHYSISLVEELKKGGYDSCLMTSYSVNLSFYEDFLLRKMQSVGITNHLLFVDHKMCVSAMEAHAPKRAGRFYGLVPMYCSAAFHPKIIMMLGKNKGLLIVGSHNVTISGFGNNLEITNLVKFDAKSNTEDLILFQEAFMAFTIWLNDYGRNVPDIITTMLKKAKVLAPWLNSKKAQSTDKSFLFSSSSTSSLWSKLAQNLPEDIDSTVGISAFFDSQGEFLQVLKKNSKTTPVIGIQPSRVLINKEIIKSSEAVFKDITPIYGNDIHSYAHAKAIAFYRGDERFFVSGSANFSSNAWLKSGRDANAEAIILLNGDDAVQALESTSIQELQHSETIRELPSNAYQFDVSSAKSTLLLFATINSDQFLTIVLEEKIAGSKPFYKDDLGQLYPLSSSSENLLLKIPRDQLNNDGLIHLCIGSDTVALVVIVDIPSLEKLCESSDERQLRQAILSLDSDSPQFDLLFKFINKFAPKLNQSRTLTSNQKYSTNDEVQKESLIANIDLEQNLASSSGRRRVSSSGLEAILDMFLYSMPSSHTESNALYREDSLGRNEEELVGSDDEVVKVRTRISQEQAQYVQGKIKNILGKLEKLLSSKFEPDSDNTSFLLMTLVLIHNLSRYEFDYEGDNKLTISPISNQPKSHRTDQSESVVHSTHLNKLADILFQQYFGEKTFPVQISEQTANIFNSDEYTKVLAYSTWLLFKTDAKYADSLPLSGRKDDCERINLLNARMLFVIQRLDGDSKSALEAENLLEEESAEALAWLYNSVKITEALLYEETILCKGYKLVRSTGNGFNGYCFLDVERNNNEMVELCSVSEKLAFKRSYLEI
ncbi:TPA: hypothetical protein ACF4E7_000399 [Vibrio parahaemolyticus]